MVAALKMKVDLETLLEIYNSFGYKDLDTVMEAAAANGRIDFIEEYYNHTYQDDPHLLYMNWRHIVFGAFKANRLDILKTAFTNCLICTEEILTEWRDTALYKWLEKQGNLR